MNKAPRLFKFQWLVGLILITSVQKTSILKQLGFIGTLSRKYVTVGSLLKCQVHNVSKWSMCARTCVCVCVCFGAKTGFTFDSPSSALRLLRFIDIPQ